MENSEKIQKLIARAGVASRRQAEVLIADGEVTVNGKVATIGDRALPTDRISVRGKSLHTNVKSKVQLLFYHKPMGEVCTRHDPEGRPTVFERLPRLATGRWIVIGRLDVNTSGLLLFTNDGETAHRLMHPSFGVEREYAVRLSDKLSEEAIARLKKGVRLEDGPAKFDQIKSVSKGQGQNHWYHVVIAEGRNREVRRLFESQNVMVNRLRRIRYGIYRLPKNSVSGQFLVQSV
jgi:23S rRNA pseudouridine2605 synthase